MMRIRKSPAAAAAVLLLAQAAATRAETNPLLGSWTFSEGDAGGCAVRLVFAANSQTATLPHSQPHTNQVTYSASPSSVTVIGNAGYVIYKILGPDRIKLDSGAVNCTYRRG